MTADESVIGRESDDRAGNRGLRPAFAAELRAYRGCFKLDRTAGHFDTCCRGLLADLPRKTLEPIALAAGTKNVVASLWKVPDQSTAALMALFYRNLWEKNLSPLAALREAQLEIYRNPDRIGALADGFRGPFKEVDAPDIKATADGKAHPRLWAAFLLSGLGR